MAYNAPIYASSFSETLPGSLPGNMSGSMSGNMSGSLPGTTMTPPQMNESNFPGSPINMSQSYMSSPSQPKPQNIPPVSGDKKTDKQIIDKLGEVFGHKPVVNYWPLLTYIILWAIFGLVIFIIFLAAGQVGWGFYYLTVIIFSGIVFSMLLWVMCKEGYSTISWVIVGLMFFVSIGFVIWAAIAYPNMKNYSRSPFG